MTSNPKCRHCGSPLTQTFADLGTTPLANSYVPVENKGVPCPSYPLHARVCGTCFLVQVEDAVPAEQIFSDEYAYFSSFSDSWLKHCQEYVDGVVSRFHITSDDLVIEIASNNGYLLQYFRDKNIPVLGIEPAANVAAAAEKRGVQTRIEFFTEGLAKTLLSEGKQPALICSANVLAHVPDINDFVKGIATLLPKEGIYTVEFPHLLSPIENVQFDTIYHEHYTYLSLLSVERIFSAAGLRVFDLEILPTHGGSLRIYACQSGAQHAEVERVSEMRKTEEIAGLHQLSTYQSFQERILAVRKALLDFLNTAKADGKSLAAYGAAAKGNTLLNYCQVGTELITYCVDRNPAKQNTLLPGSHIPVFAPEHLRDKPTDYVLILPWNLRTEIQLQLADLTEKGTKLVTPLPTVQVL